MQDGAGFDGGELVGVAQQDEAGVGGGGGDECVRQFEREHRGFVDDDDVVRQRAAGVVLRFAVVVDAEQAVQGLCGQAADARGGEAFFHAFCGFAGGGGKGDADVCRSVLFGADEAGNGVGFAGAGAAVDEGEATAAREANGVLLFCAQAVCGDGFGGGVGGVQALADAMGLCLDEVMVAGDADNDYEMLEMGAFSVVPENGRPKAKERARYVTASNDADGIAAAIEKFVL